MAESQMEYNWVYKFDYFMICLLHESSSCDEKLNEWICFVVKWGCERLKNEFSVRL